MTAQEVIDAFSEWTGIRFKFVPHGVQRQAAAFVTHGFSLEGLELVIAWIRRQIARGVNGFSSASLQWRVLMGEHGAADEFMRFQERLGLAQEAIRRGWKPRLGSKANDAVPAKPEAIPAPATEEPQATDAAVKSVADDFWDKMGFRLKKKAEPWQQR